MIRINRFDVTQAIPAHDGTILGMKAFGPGLDEPFQHFYGHLETIGIMDGNREGHSHPAAEVYIVMEGEGVVHIRDEEAMVREGDVVEIPRNAPHTMENRTGFPLTWLALWWE